MPGRYVFCFLMLRLLSCSLNTHSIFHAGNHVSDFPGSADISVLSELQSRFQKEVSMKIAIAGVGGIGKHILDALLKTTHSICTLSTRVSCAFQYHADSRLAPTWKTWALKCTL